MYQLSIRTSNSCKLRTASGGGSSALALAIRFSSAEGSRSSLGIVEGSTGPRQAPGGSDASVFGGCMGVNTFLRTLISLNAAVCLLGVAHVASFPAFFNITDGPPG